MAKTLIYSTDSLHIHNNNKKEEDDIKAIAINILTYLFLVLNPPKNLVITEERSPIHNTTVL